MTQKNLVGLHTTQVESKIRADTTEKPPTIRTKSEMVVRKKNEQSLGIEPRYPDGMALIDVPANH